MDQVIERPTRAHALRVATELFVSGQRVDMTTLSRALGIGRTTLHRWVGDREQLLGEVLANLTDDTWDVVAGQAAGEGAERAIDTIRRFMEATAAFVPLRTFAERESQLALRVLCSPDSPVPVRIGQGIRRAFAANVPAGDIPGPELLDVMVQVGTTLEWTPIVIGEPPAIPRAVEMLRWLVADR